MLGALAGQLYGALVGRCCGFRVTGAAIEIGPHGMEQVVIENCFFRDEGLKQPKPICRRVTHGNGDRPVECDYRRGLLAVKRIVKPDNSRPVGGIGLKRLGMHGSDGGLQGVGAGGETARASSRYCSP